MVTVKVQEAKTRLSALLTRVEHGEEITIARGNQAVARLVPFDADRKRDLGFVANDVPETFFEALPAAELAGWDGLVEGGE